MKDVKEMNDLINSDTPINEVIRDINTSIEETTPPTQEELENIKEKGKKIRVTEILMYLIYVLELLQSFYLRFSNFSLPPVEIGNDGAVISVTLLRVLSWMSGRLLLYVGVYGVIATVFRKHFEDFYRVFTIASVLMFIVSLLVYVL